MSDRVLLGLWRRDKIHPLASAVPQDLVLIWFAFGHSGYRNHGTLVLQVLCGNRLGTVHPKEDSFGVKLVQFGNSLPIHWRV